MWSISDKDKPFEPVAFRSSILQLRHCEIAAGWRVVGSFIYIGCSAGAITSE